ncbi:MAG: MucR family transcriptional regulator [Rickettsiales bacterium]|jgi:predicted transcriptional regulator|nr:MucR family transcriptional regulator [Rickettsiales bacterium]
MAKNKKTVAAGDRGPHSEERRNGENLIAAAAQIAAAKIAGNPALRIDDVVQEALASLKRAASHQLTALEIKDSVKPDYIVCFEDGTKHKMLRRYLKRKFNLTPEAYREKWNLADDYPLVAPAYAKVRSNLAKRSGLGKSSVRRPRTK